MKYPEQNNTALVKNQKRASSYSERHDYILDERGCVFRSRNHLLHNEMLMKFLMTRIHKNRLVDCNVSVRSIYYPIADKMYRALQMHSICRDYLKIRKPPG